MNCIIIDDEKTARIILRTLCSQVENLTVVDEFPNAIQAIKFLNKNEVDLIFLDIHMPDFTGFDFLKALKNPPKIVLTTSDPDFAIEAFEYESVLDYLLKPIEFSRFEKTILKALKEPETEEEILKDADDSSIENDFYVNINRRLIKIDIPSIYLVEAKGDYIKIKTKEQNYIVHSTLKKIEDKLPDSLFLKVHRSYIINVKEIIDIEYNSVLIQNDVIPVSRPNRPELMKRLNLL